MPRQNPLSSSGPLPMVYALPSEGPYFPCAIKDDRGEQIPCDDGEVRACHTYTHSTRTHGAQHRAVDCCNQRVDGRCLCGAGDVALAHAARAEHDPARLRPRDRQGGDDDLRFLLGDALVQGDLVGPLRRPPVRHQPVRHRPRRRTPLRSERQASHPAVSSINLLQQILLQSAILTRSCLRSNDAPVEYAGRRGRLRAAGGVVDAAPVRSRRHQREREPFGRDSRDA